LVEACYRQPPLLDETPAEKAEIAVWYWRIAFEGLLAIAEALRGTSPAMANRTLPGPADYAQIPELTRRGLARVQQLFVTQNEQLAARDIVTGATASALPASPLWWWTLRA
jgi:glutathione S-transferase